MAIFIFSVLFALGVSGMCSLLEATLLSLTPAQVAQMSQERPRIGAIWQRFKDNIERPIAVILIINTASHTIGATIAGSQFKTIAGETFGSNAPAYIIGFSVIFTFLMLQVSEILPKTIGVRQNRRIAPLIALPLYWLTRIFSPISYFVHLLNRPFEGKAADGERPATLEQIAALAALARMSKLIGREQERIITGASKLSGRTVGEVMIPLDQITHLSTEQSLDQAVDAARQDPHTRFPIFDKGDPDEVIGYVNFKELIFLRERQPDTPDMDDIIRPIQFVRPDEPVPELLEVFVHDHAHMAIVRDEDGKSLGLITMEDIVEELVGELEDEFDRLPRHCHPMRGGSWMIGGGVPLSVVASRLGMGFPETGASLSDWLIEKLGKAPKTGASLEHAGSTFAVHRTRRGKVFEVAVRRSDGTVGL